MIYYKIKSQIYNNPESIKTEYPLYYNRIKALYRVLKNEFKGVLRLYPNIDIYISTKNVHRVLGRFTSKATAEYKRKGNIYPYIVLYWHNIERFYIWHCVKGFKAVLYHEFLHYSQWLLGQKCKHKKSKGLAMGITSADNVDIELNIAKKHLQRYNFKAIYK